MQNIQVYADTSVFGGVFDAEFQDASQTFFEQVKTGNFSLVISPILEEELENAPDFVRELYTEIASLSEAASKYEEAVQLQDAYMNANIVTPKYADDALHVAFASVSQCSILVSWNFKHIVHYDKISLYNKINIELGYRKLGFTRRQR